MDCFGADLISSEFRTSETSALKRLKTVSLSETWKAIGAVEALLGLRHPDTIAGKLKKGALEWRKSVKIATRFREDPTRFSQNLESGLSAQENGAAPRGRKSGYSR